MTVEPMPVTVIGMGPMGRALAGALLRAGHTTTVWNRTPGKADELVRLGARDAASPAEAIRAGALTVCCLVDDNAVQSVLENALGQLDSPRPTVVNLTADSPHRTRELAEWLEPEGVTLLDGAIMTPAAAIGTDATRILYSGPTETFRACRDVLAAFGGEQHYLGEVPSAAATYDVALLSLFWTSVGGLVHAFALARSAEIAAEQFAPHARAMAGLLADLVPGLAADLDHGRFDGADSASLDSLSVSLAHLESAFDQASVPTALLADLHQIVERAREAGHGGDAPIRLAELLART